MSDTHTSAGRSGLGTRRRKMTTTRSVLIADVISRACITTGGIGTIGAVLGVLVFLVWVVLPLFQGARVGEAHTMERGSPSLPAIHAMVDDYLTTGAFFGPGGEVRAFALDDGHTLFEADLFPEATVSAFSYRTGLDEVVYALSDGSLAIVDLRFKTAFPSAASVDSAVQRDLAVLPPNGYVPHGKGILQLTPEGQYRSLTLQTTISSRTAQPHGPASCVSHARTPAGLLIVYAVQTATGPALFGIVGETSEDMMTGEKRLDLLPAVALPLPDSDRAPDYLAVAANGQDVYAAWRDGRVIRLRCPTMGEAFVAETGRLIEDQAEITAVAFALGGTTLMWGDSQGRVAGGFPVRINLFDGTGLPDSVLDPRSTFRMALTKRLGEETSAVEVLRPCARSRLMFVGYRDGGLAVYNSTSEARLVKTALPGHKPVFTLCVAPRENGIMALDTDRMYLYEFDPKYTDADFNSLFRPIWYEGYPAAMHMWQSSSASDDFEPKMGLMPLIFGTLKATFYAMLFGGPIALMAAIFSSEFLHPRIKAVVKPTVELMASLPSVVLGFLGALVFAPFVEAVIPATMIFVPCCFACFLLGAYLWQTLPVAFTRQHGSWRLAFMILPIVAALAISASAGSLMERLLFAGDIKGWLAWQPGPASDATSPFAAPTGGWALLLLPFAILVVVILVNRLITPAMRRAFTDAHRDRIAWMEVAKFSLATIVTIGLALAMGALLSLLGLDPRFDLIVLHTDMSPMDIYVQRNALIVGVVMGFAVIPIVYTIADDALTSVPGHLRSASLGCGATTWQTAIRIVIPTAMSGLFSAMMIGLGRAVGETMIVLMALGNTAIMDWNIFNGARTLSANIAVELPEAVRNSAHYRTLFLAGLVLFAMTFVVNTVAESVRLRFRKRAYQL